jgi:hypothetical protein
LLTKAIVRFPPGTTKRWQQICDFIGSKNQKETIKKAQEIASKRTKEHEQRQASGTQQATGPAEKRN